MVCLITLSLIFHFPSGKSSLFVGCKKAYLLYRPGEGGAPAGPAPVEVAVPGPSTAPCIGSVWAHSASSAPGREGKEMEAGSYSSSKGGEGSASSNSLTALGSYATGGGKGRDVGNGGGNMGRLTDAPVSSSATGGSEGEAASSREVLLSCGNSIVFFGEDGKPIKR